MITSVMIFSLLWLLLTGMSWTSLVIGIPAIAVAAYTSKRIAGNLQYSISFFAALKFLAFFIMESFKGGFDIANRAFSFKSKVQPHYIHYQTSLPAGLPQILFLSTVSLLPGTLTVDSSENKLLVHALVSSNTIASEISKCEQHIRAIFR